MSDGISVKVITADAKRKLARVNYEADRASAYAVREAGRKAKQAARRKAPVYKGAARTMRVNGTEYPVQPGQLKDAIRSSKRLRRIPGGGYALKVGPRGAWTHLYAPAQEARFGFMQAGYDAASAQMAAIYEKAIRAAMRTANRKT